MRAALVAARECLEEAESLLERVSSVPPPP